MEVLPFAEDATIERSVVSRHQEKNGRSSCLFFCHETTQSAIFIFNSIFTEKHGGSRHEMTQYMSCFLSCFTDENDATLFWCVKTLEHSRVFVKPL